MAGHDGVRQTRKIPARTQGKQVLLVEDNAVNQKVSAGLLKSLGCAVDVAGNGREAVAVTASKSYDLIWTTI